MTSYTIEEVKSWGICYPREQLEKLYAGREKLTALDCFDLDVPDDDKLFVLLRPEIIPERELHLLACDFAERVTRLAGDPRSAKAIRVKRLWVEGKATNEELRTARDAALAAACAAAEAAEAAACAAWAAAKAEAAAARAAKAAAAAAWAAAWAAWEAAAWDAAWDAADAAAEARTAERKAQLALVRKVVERLDSNEGA